jgi:hypothetical protein
VSKKNEKRALQRARIPLKKGDLLVHGSVLRMLLLERESDRYPVWTKTAGNHVE